MLHCWTMSTLLIAHLSCLTAVFMVCSLHGLSFAVARTGEGASLQLLKLFGILLIALMSLSLRAWIHAPMWEWILILGLGFGFWHFLLFLLRALKNLTRPKTSSAIFLALISFCLYFEWIWTGLPLYHYDQWTYHLVVAKWVDLLGTLKGPFSIDHVFFTGSYEYIGLLGRRIFQDDAFQQGFQGCFTSLLIASIVFRLCWDVVRSRVTNLWQQVLLSLSFCLWTLFSSGDHEALSSAKPDFLLMAGGMLLLTLMKSWKTLESRTFYFWFGFCLTGLLSLKITWIHGLISLMPAVLLLTVRGRYRLRFWSLGAGMGLGGMICLPLFIKNYLTFQNPFYPAQTRLWASNVWSPELADYWEKVLEKPHGVGEFVSNLWVILLHLPQRWMGLLLVLGGLGILALIKRRVLWVGIDLRFSRDPWVLTLVIYILMWGFFYSGDTSHRFVSLVPALAGAILLNLIPRLKISDHQLCVLLLLPFLNGGEIEVTLRRIHEAWGKTTKEFHDQYQSGPLALNKDLDKMRVHRDLHFGAELPYDRGTMISDSLSNFYGPSAFYDGLAPVLKTLMIQAEVGTVFKNCPAIFFKQRDIRYLWIADLASLPKWPPKILKFRDVATRLETDHGELWFIPDLERLFKFCEHAD